VWAAIVGARERMRAGERRRVGRQLSRAGTRCHDKLIRGAQKRGSVVRWYSRMAEMFEMLRGDDAAVSPVRMTSARSRLLDGVPGTVRVGTMDLGIAAIALSRNLTVVTREHPRLRPRTEPAGRDWTH
jgi:predicted nucleic acid-binding protein